LIVIEKMFRESDYENCKKHETFINRPLSIKDSILFTSKSILGQSSIAQNHAS
jgi:hypothetical protein